MHALKTPSRHYVIFFLLSLAGYLYLSYFLERENSTPLLITYTLLFAGYLWSIMPGPLQGAMPQKDSQENWIALGLRLSLLFTIPNLSDDFYRFIWDGYLLNAGKNPFAQLPSFYMETGEQVPGLTQELYTQLNSPNYFTIYPPVNQFIFWLSTLIQSDGVLLPVLVMRGFILASEVGNIWLLPKVLTSFGINAKYSRLYTFNPLVIIEGVGNLHFEVMMFLFILLSLWYLKKNHLIVSAVAMGLAVATKLIPLIFLPFLPRPLSVKRLTIYYGTCGLSIVILFLPLLSSELIDGMQNSLSLYYQKFEFNASIYYILREQGFREFGYNRIEFIGKDLVKWTFWAIIFLALWPFGKRPGLPTLLMFALGIYLLMSTVVHPWYIITLIGLSVFTNYRSPILWSFTIFFTYAGYSTNGFQLPYWIIIVEYASLGMFFIYEVLRNTGLIKGIIKR